MSSSFIPFKYCIYVSLCFSYSSYLVTQHRSTNSFLTSTIDGGESSVSRPGHFMLWERVPCTHSVGDRVGPRGGQTFWRRDKLPTPLGLKP